MSRKHERPEFFGSTGKFPWLFEFRNDAVFGTFADRVHNSLLVNDLQKLRGRSRAREKHRFVPKPRFPRESRKVAERSSARGLTSDSKWRASQRQLDVHIPRAWSYSTRLFFTAFRISAATRWPPRTCDEVSTRFATVKNTGLLNNLDFLENCAELFPNRAPTARFFSHFWERRSAVYVSSPIT